MHTRKSCSPLLVSILYTYKWTWTASPVPIDPKLVSFHTIAKCQTFFTCKISWLVESIESDWGASFWGAWGKYEIVIGHLKGVLYKIDQGSGGQLPPPPASHAYQTIINFFLNILAPCHGGPGMWISGTRMHQWQATTVQNTHSGCMNLLQHMDQLMWVLTNLLLFR